MKNILHKFRSIRPFTEVISKNEPTYSKITHYPVLYKPFLKILETKFSSKKPFLMLDCTLGGAGHSSKVLQKFPNSRIIGLDIDPEMLALSTEKLDKFIKEKRAALYHKNFASFSTIDFEGDLDLSAFPPPKKNYDIILADLGLNSFQLDTPERGFSYKNEGELDMRYDRSRSDTSTCSDIVNSTSEYELQEIFYKFSDEPQAKAVASRIVKGRKGKIIKTTKDLHDIIWNSFNNISQKNKYKILTRVFQVFFDSKQKKALRIAVNYEFVNLQRFFDNSINFLEENGLMIMITFHSGELKIVNDNFFKWERDGKGVVLNRVPILPNEQEVLENSRSHSAAMKIFFKTSSNK